MALSMDEQRMLAEIERRLAAEDPGLASRLSSFKRSGATVKLRSSRSRAIGVVFAVAAAVVLSVMVYAMIPFRAHAPRPPINPQATGGVSASAPATAGQRSASSTHPAAASGGAAQSGTAGQSGTGGKTSTAAKAAGTAAKTAGKAAAKSASTGTP